MPGREFPLLPAEVPPVKTAYRCIQTRIPVPASIELLGRLRDLEPRSMGGQPPIVWHRGDGVTVSDPYGNTWLDFSSGVLVTASGHGHPAIVRAIQAMAGQGLYHAYCFPTSIRYRLVEELTSWLPPPLSRVFLLTTGAEAVECCIKLARTRGLAIGSTKKNVIVSFENAFHGRTMGAQLVGGSPALKAWLGGRDPRFVQVPFPDGFRQKDTSFEVFEQALERQGISPSSVCGVICETYQGCNATILPADYARKLRVWCDRHQAVLILDEVQAGFGRTGAPFGFNHFDIVPDLVACGKGIAGGMPLSAVLGTDELMNLYGPGEMTSTHSANPVCCAAALANLHTIRGESLIDNAARFGPMLLEGARAIQKASGGRIGHVAGIGLVAALQFTRPGTTEPDPDGAWQMTRAAIERGVMLFAPVGVGGATIKLNPPLCITADALQEGLEVLREIAAEMAAGGVQNAERRVQNGMMKAE